jgi:glycogen synthase
LINVSTFWSMLGAHVRVGIFSSAYPGINGTGGIPVYTHSLATGLVALGHEAHVLVHDEKGELDEHFDVDGVHLHAVRAAHAPVIARWLRGSRESVQTSMAALRLCLRHRLDLFEFPNFDAMGAPFGALRRVAPPMVVRLHTSTAECLAIENKKIVTADRFDIWREHAQCRRAAALVVSTSAHGKHMAEELGIDASAIGLVPLGLPDDARAELRKPRPRKASPTVVYVGRLEPRKGTLDLLEAIPKVLGAVPGARFIFCGNDRPLAPGNVKYGEWVKTHLPAEVQAQIELTGYVDDATRERFVAEADVFAAPSLYESFGLIFLEAMRLSVPVVGTTAGGIPEVVEDGKTGLLVPPRDANRLADAIIRLLKTEEDRVRIAAAGRASFVQKFSNLAMAERTIAHHEALLSRAHLPYKGAPNAA